MIYFLNSYVHIIYTKENALILNFNIFPARKVNIVSTFGKKNIGKIGIYTQPSF